MASRRGISTALATVFMISIVMVTIGAIIVIDSFEIRYERVRGQMVEWDIQRKSENLRIRDFENSAPLGYDFTLKIDNMGGITVNTARLYIYNKSSQELMVYDPQILGGAGFVNGTITAAEVDHWIAVKGTPLNANYTYDIVLATERGRQFNYTYPQPPTEYKGWYALVIADRDGNFQYAAGTDPTFKSAFVKAKNTDTTLYRVLIKNTTKRKIIFHQNSTMIQMGSAPGQVIHNVRYIVSNQSSNPSNLHAYVYQIVGPSAVQYVYFAATLPGSNDWQGEVNLAAYYLVVFLFYWQYEGEIEVRNVSTPAVAQEITR